MAIDRFTDGCLTLRSWLALPSLLSSDMHHRPRRRHKSRLPDVVPFFFLLHHLHNELRELLVRRAAPHQLVQVVIPHRKQTRTELAIRGDANSAAMSAEWMRHRRNDSKLAHAIGKAISPRRFAALVRNLLQRQILRHARENLVERNYNFRSPNTVLFERHEFDEAHHHPLFPCELSEVNDLIFIESAQQHAIDFHRIEPRLPRCANSPQHALVSIRHTRNARKSFGVHRVHADRHAIKPSIFERLGNLSQQMAVRRQRYFRLAAVRGAQICKVAYEVHNPFAQQRLATRQANLRDPEPNQYPRHPQIIFEREFRIRPPVRPRPAETTLLV